MAFYYKKINAALFIISIIAVMLLANCIKISADVKHRTAYDIIEVNGYVNPSGIKNRYVTVLLKNGEQICNIGQTPVLSDGTYSYMFAIDNYSDNMVLSVKEGDKDIEDTVMSAVVKSVLLENVPYTLKACSDGTTEVETDLSYVKKYTADFEVIVASYDESGLKDVLSKSSTSLSSTDLMKCKIKTGNRINVMVVNSFTDITPKAKSTQYEGSLKISFGEEADKLYNNEYNTLSGDNNYQIYKNAVNELPEEFNVLTMLRPEVMNKFYVSVLGSDLNNGSVEKPFRTVNKAIEAYNLLEDDKKWWTGIYIKAGNYEYSEFDALSSISGDAKLVVESFGDGEVLFSGAKIVSGSRFELVTAQNTDEETLSRINPLAKGNLYSCDYADFDITALNGFKYGNRGNKPLLVFNNILQTNARYPNSYDMNIAKNGVVKDGLIDGVRDAYGDVEFIPDDSRPFTWKNNQNIGMCGQLSVSWYINHMKATINSDAGTISTPVETSICHALPYGPLYKLNVFLQNNPMALSHYYFYNVFEEIDMSGEWTGDDLQQKIFFYSPYKPTSNDCVKIEGDEVSSLIKISDAKNIIISGINFEFAKYGVNLTNCENVVVQNSKFKYISDNALFLRNSEKCGAIYSEFKNLNRAVSIVGDDEALYNLECSQCFVQNCHFNEIDSTGIYIENSCFNIVSHNLAENHLTAFVSVFGSTDNVIEYNESRSGVLQGNEGNNIYLDGEFVSRNNHIRYNYLHDNSPRNSGIILGYALAADDMGENWYVYGNVFENVDCGAYINGGDNNIFDNNIFVDCPKFAYAAVDTMYGNYINNNLSETGRPARFYVERAFDMEGNSGYMQKYIKYDIVNSEKYNSRYPNALERYNYIKNLAENYSEDNKNNSTYKFAKAVTGNYLINNLYVNCGSPKLNHASETEGFDETYVVYENPEAGVKKFDNQDLNVYYNNINGTYIDFETIDKFDKMGIYKEPEYTSEMLKVLYPSSTVNEIQSDKLCFVWSDLDKANYYKVTISKNKEMFDDIDTSYVIDNRYSYSINEKGTYYYEIEAFCYTYGGNDMLIDSISGSIVLK